MLTTWPDPGQAPACEPDPSSVFQDAYAGAYDDLYSDKDYLFETDVIERVLRSHARRQVRRVLDLGCGTGGHALPLAARGFEVEGVDRAEPMLERARRKSKPCAGVGIRWHRADIRQVRLNRRFDAALMMFAVLGYQIEDADVRAALASARAHLDLDGLLLFDVWFGPAVLRRPPVEKIKNFTRQGQPLTRRTLPELDRARNVCRVTFDLLDAHGRPFERETHVMRYFFPAEIEGFLRESGFRRTQLSAFPDIRQPADENAWNALIVAQAV
ncbi:MAG: methyltransferase domain-containing protein [Phycisphaerales bacterium]|nr:methyltransferase domain-containing protein [Phycisphaerales bacterium]